MRFRPFAASGTVVSAVSLALTDAGGRRRPADWTALVYRALENGVNCFEVQGVDPAIAEGLAEALRAVDRRLVFIAWRLGRKLGPTGGPVRDFRAEALALAAQSALARTGLDYLDLVMLDDPRGDELSTSAMATLKALRASGGTRMLGVAGEGEAMDFYISSRHFDVLAIPYNLISGWRDRHRLKAAVERDMPVIGYGYYPRAFHQQQQQQAAQPASRSGFWGGRARVDPLAGAGTYAFLDRTEGWTAERICLAYALTEPAIATVQIVADQLDAIDALAMTADRDLPPGVAAQIEMARFGGKAEDQDPRRRA